MTLMEAPGQTPSATAWVASLSNAADPASPAPRAVLAAETPPKAKAKAPRRETSDGVTGDGKVSPLKKRWLPGPDQDQVLTEGGAFWRPDLRTGLAGGGRLKAAKRP